MIILDSSFVIAFHNSRDTHHPAASETMKRLLEGEWGSALLPEYIFLEVVTVLAARRDLATAIRVGSILLNSRDVEFVPCSDLFGETLAVFQAQAQGPVLSFADSAIVALARRRSSRFVATFDRGFARVSDLTVVP